VVWRHNVGAVLEVMMLTSRMFSVGGRKYEETDGWMDIWMDMLKDGWMDGSGDAWYLKMSAEYKNGQTSRAERDPGEI